MGRYAPNLSNEQREAVTRAMLEDGMSAGEVVELAAAGQLGLPAFEVSESTARDLRAEAERERDNGTVDDPGPPADQATAQALAFAEREIARIEALETPSAKELSAYREALRIKQDAERQAEKRAARERLVRKPQQELDPRHRELSYRLLLARAEGGPVLPAWWSSGNWLAAWDKAQTQGPCTCAEPYPWDTNDDGLPVWPERWWADRLELPRESGVGACCLACLRPVTAAVQAQAAQ
jgi:hypothetical protein